MSILGDIDVKTLAVELQSLGVRTAPLGPDVRAGGAGPGDAGFLWVDGAPLTVPVGGEYVADSPYELVLDRAGGKAGTQGLAPADEPGRQA